MRWRVCCGIAGLRVRPITFQAKYGPFVGKTLHGVQLYLLDPAHTPLMQLQFLFMEIHHTLYPHHNPFSLAERTRLQMFDKVVGTDRVRKTMERTMTLESILPILNEGVEEFVARARTYHLYH